MDFLFSLSLRAFFLGMTSLGTTVYCKIQSEVFVFRFRLFAFGFSQDKKINLLSTLVPGSALAPLPHSV